MPNVDTALGRAWTWWRRGGWYFAVVLGSFGILSPIPYAHAATRLRDARLWAWSALYAVGVATVLVLAETAPKDATGRPDGGIMTAFQVVLTLALWTVPCIQLRSIRRRAHRLPEPHPAGTDSAHPAVAAALAARARRTEARRLAAVDPPLARELGIGRPDLRRGFDDGGLVELNTAPAAVIAHLCDLPRVVADQVVGARVDGVGTLTGPDDLMAYLDLPLVVHERIRDRGIVLDVLPARR